MSAANQPKTPLDLLRILRDQTKWDSDEQDLPIRIFTDNGMFEIIGVYNENGHLVLDTRRA